MARMLHSEALFAGTVSTYSFEKPDEPDAHAARPVAVRPEEELLYSD